MSEQAKQAIEAMVREVEANPVKAAFLAGMKAADELQDLIAANRADDEAETEEADT